MSQITLRTIQKARNIAQAQIDKNGYLTENDRNKILNMQHYNRNISAELSHQVWIFTEVICARLTQTVWEKNTLSPFQSLPPFLLDLAYDHFLTHSEPNYRHKVLWEFSALIEDFGEYELSGEDFNSRYLDSDERKNQDHAVKVYYALNAFRKAVRALDSDSDMFSCDLELSTETSSSNWPDEEVENWWAADYAAMATDLSPKEFWTWYVTDCLSQALKDAQKYFPDL